MALSCLALDQSYLALVESIIMVPTVFSCVGRWHGVIREGIGYLIANQRCCVRETTELDKR